MSSSQKAVIFGARRDGSAKVLLDILMLAGTCDVVGFLDDNKDLWGQKLAGVPILGGRDLLTRLRDQGVAGIAFAVGDNRTRAQRLEEARAVGLRPLIAVHPGAWVARDVTLGDGVWIAAGAVVNPGTTVGDGAVINTGATVDHDCRLAPYVNVSPGCHLSGRTTIDRYAFLGTGVITLPDARIGEGATVGAGAVVVTDVSAGTTVVGIPARVLRRE